MNCASCTATLSCSMTVEVLLAAVVLAAVALAAVVLAAAVLAAAVLAAVVLMAAVLAVGVSMMVSGSSYLCIPSQPLEKDTGVYPPPPHFLDMNCCAVSLVICLLLHFIPVDVPWVHNYGGEVLPSQAL